AAANWTSTTSSTNSKAISGLTAATVYLFQVQAVCGATNGTYSSQGSFTTLSAGGCSDTYESNNTSSTAKVIPLNTDINALISSTSDLDWFKFTTVSPNTNVQVNLTNLPADYDVKLYSSGLSTLATGQNGGTTSESIKRNTSTATTYYVRVYGYNGANSTTQCYKLRVNASSIPFRFEDNLSEASKEDLLSGIVTVPNPVSSLASFEFISDMPGNSSVSIIDITGKMVYSGMYEVKEGVNKIEQDVTVFAKGVYVIMIQQNNERRIGKFLVQ
ncbi:MAG TPA: T9SS type A sorting domain-containing protein, partial [Bacteroidia bacterium]|nr:T9SS type A sorting domain-containing protein [Bacteroidia bacterium]